MSRPSRAPITCIIARFRARVLITGRARYCSGAMDSGGWGQQKSRGVYDAFDMWDRVIVIRLRGSSGSMHGV
jgi:hypothetical protein